MSQPAFFTLTANPHWGLFIAHSSGLTEARKNTERERERETREVRNGTFIDSFYENNIDYLDSKIKALQKENYRAILLSRNL